MSQPTGEPTPDTGTVQPPTATPPDTGAEATDWKAEAEKWQALARKQEDRAKANVSAAQQADQYKKQYDAMLKAAGINPDGTGADDPATAAAQLAERAEAAEARLWTAGVKTNVYDLAAAVGANAKLVFNSNEFRDTLDDLVDEDPDKPEFRTALEQKMREFVAANPEYAVAGKATTGPRPDPSQGARGPAPAKRATSMKEAIERHYRPTG